MMRIAGEYSFKKGEEAIKSRFPDLLNEISDVIRSIDASAAKRKRSKEKTMRGRILYSPKKLNKAFKLEFSRHGWATVRVPCQYSQSNYQPGYTPRPLGRGAFREMDFIKNRLGVEVQFGKYAFMVYNVCAKMTIFKKLSHIDLGVEIVPVKAFADEMSTGVSYFEQFIWDLDHRGVADIDVPVLILGIDK